MISYALIATVIAVSDTDHHKLLAPVHMVIQQRMFEDQCKSAQAGYKPLIHHLEKQLGGHVKITCEVDGVFE